MDTRQPVFAQLMGFLPKYDFQKCVQRYNGQYKIKSFACWDQFLCMAFAQLTYRESLRDIEACLRSAQHNLYHMGFRGKVSRNTLAHANEVRDWQIYADFAQILIARARHLYANDSFGVELKQMVYALDSTTIDLCRAAYSSAKKCLEQFTRVFATGLGPYNITVNAISPGRMIKPTGALRVPKSRLDGKPTNIPMGRYGTPEDLHGAVVFLASDASQYVTGVNILVDGGYVLIN